MQGAATAIAQAGETEAGEVDLVLGNVEVGDGVIETGGRVAVTVRLRDEPERIGTGAASEFVDAGAADQDVATGCAIDRIVAGATVENLGGGAAEQGVVCLLYTSPSPRDRG